MTQPSSLPNGSGPSGATPAGWFPDPLGRHEHRFFNGTAWTADVSDDGRRYVDPLGTGTSPNFAPSGSGRNGIATAALVCGIIGMVIAWVPFIVVGGLVLAILAIVFGVRGLRRAGTLGTGRGAAITGIVTGIIGLALSVLGIALSVILFQAIDRFVDPGPVVSEVTACTPDGSSAVVDGTVTNRSDTTRDYTVFISLDERTTALSLDNVEAGDTVSWSTTVRASGDGDCDPTIDVQGPFPFGIELDPIDN